MSGRRQDWRNIRPQQRSGLRSVSRKLESVRKKAGPIRNEEMAKYASETYGILIAFWDGKSRGMKNMIDTAKKHGLEIYIVQI